MTKKKNRVCKNRVEKNWQNLLYKTVKEEFIWQHVEQDRLFQRPASFVFFLAYFLDIKKKLQAQLSVPHFLILVISSSVVQ